MRHPGGRWILVAVLLVACGPFPAGAVDFQVGVDRDSVTVGEPFTVRMRVWRNETDVTGPLEAPPLPGGAFDVLDRTGPTSHTLDGDRVEETLDVVVAAYRPGDYEIAPVNLEYRTAAGDTGSAMSGPVSVRVHSLVPESQTDIQDIKPPVVIPGRVPAWVWITTGVLVVGLGLLAWYVWKRRRRPKEMPPPPPVDWPAEVSKVLALGLIEKGAFRDYYFRLSEVTRRYLEDRTGVEAMERTTSEVIRDLQSTVLQSEHVAELEGFLSGADLVKFAKHTPSVRAASDTAEQVRSLMRRIDHGVVRRAPAMAVGDETPADQVKI